MAKNRKSVGSRAQQPRRAPNLQLKAQRTSNAGSIITYNAVGDSVYSNTGSSSNGLSGIARVYMPGIDTFSTYTASVSNKLVGIPTSTCAGRNLIQSYSTGRFLPGTTASWTPSVGFTSPGRIFVGFTDNPEVAYGMLALLATSLTTYAAADYVAYGSAVKNLANVVSYQIFEPFTVSMPTVIRKKRFDCNAVEPLSATTGTDALDRCMQQCMFVYIEGADGITSPGGFMFHDKVDVEGIRALALS